MKYISHKIIPNWLSKEECEELIHSAAGKYKPVQDIEIATFENADSLVLDRLFRRFEIIQKTENSWNLDLDGLSPIEVVRYPLGQTIYNGPHVDYNDHYEDILKLSFIVMLTPRESFKGGILTVGHTPVEPFEQGTLVIFPGFRMHSVSGVDEGLRIVAACWAIGPAFK